MTEWVKKTLNTEWHICCSLGYSLKKKKERNSSQNWPHYGNTVLGEGEANKTLVTLLKCPWPPQALILSWWHCSIISQLAALQTEPSRCAKNLMFVSCFKPATKSWKAVCTLSQRRLDPEMCYLMKVKSLKFFKICKNRPNCKEFSDGKWVWAPTKSGIECPECSRIPCASCHECN